MSAILGGIGLKRERDFKALEKRRLQGGKLLQKGLSATEVARRLGVTRQTVTVWQKRLFAGGTGGLKSTAIAMRSKERDL